MPAKIIFSMILLVFGFSAFAQVEKNLSTSVGSYPNRFYQNGISVGFEYMNISDVYMRARAQGPGLDDTNESSGGTHLGIAGFRAGYSQVPDRGFGWSASFSFLQAINKSEYEEKRPEFFMPQANGYYAFKPMLMVYGGTNVTFMPNASDNFLKPNLGLQGGIGFRMNRNIALNAGYTVMRFRVDENYSGGYQTTGEIRASGFNSNVTYTF